MLNATNECNKDSGNVNIKVDLNSEIILGLICNCSYLSSYVSVYWIGMFILLSCLKR